MTEPGRQLEPLAGLLQRAAALNETERAAARSAFLRRVDEEWGRSAKIRPVLRYAAPLALAMTVLLVIAFWRPQRGLDYTLEGAVDDGGYVRAAEDRSALITFSDRTRLEVSPGARLRIDEQLTQNGARIAVEEGRLDVVVTHTGRGDWNFVAGPFQVRVTGTEFAFDWDPRQERLEVTLREGSVEIEGYAGSGVVSVRAGQRFTGDAKRRTMLVSDIDVPAPPSAPSTAKESTPQQTQPAPAVSSQAEPPAVGRRPLASAKLSWSKLVSRGDFKQVVEEASARGVPSCLSSCDAADLSALADAARYVGRSDLAERSLLALRARHAPTHGSQAAFLLGRLYENKGDAARAQSWYDVSLREGPSGAFAAESLAGKMRAVHRLRGANAAREVALDYLRRYPNGVHAKSARQIAAAP